MASSQWKDRVSDEVARRKAWALSLGLVGALFLLLGLVRAFQAGAWAILWLCGTIFLLSGNVLWRSAKSLEARTEPRSLNGQAMQEAATTELRPGTSGPRWVASTANRWEPEIRQREAVDALTANCVDIPLRVFEHARDLLIQALAGERPNVILVGGSMKAPMMVALTQTRIVTATPPRSVPLGEVVRLFRAADGLVQVVCEHDEWRFPFVCGSWADFTADFDRARRA